MRARRLIFPLVAAALALALWWLSKQEAGVAPSVGPKSREGHVVTSGSRGPAGIAAVAPGSRGADTANLELDFPLAAPLNAPGSTIARDLDALGQIFDAWRTNFPREGNPVGDNHEIAAALMGDNPHRLALIPPNHPAINARRELCDRWGTPFRFHQVSGERMEIHSAGPDQKFGTGDDAFWSPGS